MTNLDNLIAGLELTYSAAFVPQSQSRNAGEKHVSLNWSITIGKGRIRLTTDYMQGIAHAPGYDLPCRMQQSHKNHYFNIVAEHGNYITPKLIKRFTNGNIDWWHAWNNNNGHYYHFTKNKPLPAPALKDVLYSLVLDSDVLQYTNFEQWAQEFGYNEDSRKDKKVYKACMKLALKLNTLFTNDELQSLREAFQDY